MIGQNATDEQALPEAVGIMPFVRQQCHGRGNKGLHEQVGCDVIGGLAAGQDRREGQSLIVCFARLRLRSVHESCSQGRRGERSRPAFTSRAIMATS